MLDFYTIPDEMDKPGWPAKNELIRIDGLSLKDFDDLIKKKLIADRFDFWTDFRWSKSMVTAMYNVLLQKYPALRENKLKIKAVNKLFTILDTAVKENVGLIAYCD